MRYYKIEVSDPNSGKVMRTWTSFVNGATDPGALDIEIDLPVTSFAQPMGASGSFVRIWGISLQDIAQASNFNGMRIAVSGGMQKGLPLANPQQSGLLVSGTIQQAFGNWIGTDQTLDFLIVPVQGGKNLPINWKKGTKLADALKSTLATGFPDYTPDIQISDNLVFSQDVTGHYRSVDTLALWARTTSGSILGNARAGLDIMIKDKKFIVRDDTTARQPRMVGFADLIGQPTWFAPQQISVNVVMRGDISVLDYIKLPPTPMTTLPASQSQSRNTSVFQGVFKVFGIRHVGRFRAPSGDAWITSLFCTNVPKTTPTVDVQETAGA